MRNKITLAMAVAGMMVAVPAFAVDIPANNAGGGTIEFTGSVIEAPCSIVPESQNIQVKLGQVSNKTLKSDGLTSSPQPIDIKLTGCEFDVTASQNPPTPDLGLKSKVAVEFSGFTPVAGKTGVIPNVATDNKAANVDIQLLDSKQQPFDFTNQDADAMQQQLTPGDNTIHLWAQMIATGAATAGNVGATVTYKLKYF
ncbi:fimbrial protein [Salmonella enterica]|nr:fimbrial protein [Salmonella enterica]EGA8138847.1 fimbrial protein [Salmonella enterica]